MSRSGVLWAVAAAIVLAGCAALVGAEEATLVQGTGGSAGQGGTGGDGGGAQGGSAGAPTCKEGEAPCQNVCKDLRSDPDNCGQCGRRCEGQPCTNSACGGGAGPEVFGACPQQLEVVDVAFNDTAIYVLCSDGLVKRLARDAPVAEPVGNYTSITRSLTQTPTKVIGLLDIGGKTLVSWQDNPVGGQSNTLADPDVDLSSRLASPGGDIVFFSAGNKVKRATLVDSEVDEIGSTVFTVSVMVADPTHIYAIGRNVGAAAIEFQSKTVTQLDLLSLGKNPVHVALRPGGGALFVTKGVSEGNGKISAYSPDGGGSLGDVVSGLNDPIEAFAGPNGDAYFIEDPTGQGRIARWTQNDKSVLTLAQGQNGARALRVIEPHVYWGMPDGTLRRVPR